MASFNSTEFEWNRVDRTFIADISDLSKGGQRPVFHQVYPDAADDGINMVSYRTGTEATFAVEDVVTHDGDIVKWVLVPLRKTVQKQPALEGCRVIIYND